MSRPAQPLILIHAANKVGGMAALARELRIARQAIYQWKRVPADRILDVERLTGVPRQQLRPDLYTEQLTSQPTEAIP